jgi:hypothetical protein
LCRECGDANNKKVYFNLGQMEQLWLERYLAIYPRVFDLKNTWFS